MLFKIFFLAEGDVQDTRGEPLALEECFVVPES